MTAAEHTEQPIIRVRGLVNRFLRRYSAQAPAAYPELHHVTAPIRAAARERGDVEALNLWAGQAYPLTQERPAAELVRELADEARAALKAVHAASPATADNQHAT